MTIVGKYIRNAPGQRCQRCGADNSFRSKGTKWCYDCSKEIAKERREKDKAYVEELKKRDMVLLSVKDASPCCYVAKLRDFNFCHKCGQRLCR